MRPYEVEIFDRQFNFIFNALLDEKDLVYKFDALSPDKSTMLISKDFNPAALSNEPRAPRGWYIRIFRDDEEYQGVISGFEEGKTQNTIEFSQLMTLFNNQSIITSRATLDASIETVIRNYLISDYINNSDSQQNLYGLEAANITTTSSTTGIMDFINVSNIDDTPIVINLLNDLILKATSLYNIFFKITMNVAAKKIYIQIGKSSADAKYIEADQPNAVEKNIVIKKTNKEVNKVTIYDSYSSVTVNFYLHTDGTYSTSNTDRIYPVVNEIHYLDTYYEAKSIVDKSLNEYKNTISTYAEAYTLTEEELTALRTAVNALMPKIHNYFKVDALINHVDDDVDTYTSDDVVTIGSKNVYFYPDHWITNDFHLMNPTQLNINTNGITYYYLGTAHGHVELEGDTNVYVHMEDNSSYDQTVRPSAPLKTSELNAAMTSYKQSGEYEAEIRDVAATLLQTEGLEIVKKVFSGNKYSNYIELSFLKNDSMINPLDMEIGQVVNIIHDGVSYSSILSGKEIQNNGLVKLIFGTIRLELTKILNMKGV